MKNQQQAEAKQALRQLLDSNATATHAQRPTLHTILRHVSKSGLSRDISVKLATTQGHILDVTYMCAEILGQKLTHRNGYNTITIKGAGMDMGFEIVYRVSRAVYGDNPITPEQQQADRDAGYVIRHEWL